MLMDGAYLIPYVPTVSAVLNHQRINGRLGENEGNRRDGAPATEEERREDRAANVLHMEPAGPAPPTTGSIAQLCPYHRALVSPTQAGSTTGSPLERYLNNDPSEQYAVFFRPDTGELSTTRPCRCRESL